MTSQLLLWRHNNFYYVTGDHGNGDISVQVPRNVGRMQHEDLLEEDALLAHCDVTIAEEVPPSGQDESSGEQGGEGIRRNAH